MNKNMHGNQRDNNDRLAMKPDKHGRHEEGAWRDHQDHHNMMVVDFKMSSLNNFL